MNNDNNIEDDDSEIKNKLVKCCTNGNSDEVSVIETDRNVADMRK